MLRTLIFGALAMPLVACAAAARTPGAQLIDSANDLNNATRFGRMDVALEQTAPVARDTFMERHQAWGNEIRVVDVVVTSAQIIDEERAEVLVQIAWTRMSEGLLRSTSLRQSWRNPKSGGWQLEREQRIGGDAGLFGEPLPAVALAPARDTHFKSRSLGTTE